ncbi:NAD(P)H oxidoreductase [Paenibacillus sp. 481]|uniref:NAD(P)H oxidoreductase n=1 Tax=Paenibacillus sp. 481 TaxID=2835869 RepID=UPI001E46CDEE|nr:NAD(P)H oxidoreductase [Paenibacillus sp. 481]UHA74790.1 NAD(P)H oxidoreductase [Paenibacillus sp. 481]
MKVLTVVSHPRENSLTFAVTQRFIKGLTDAGHEAELVDLYRTAFDPMLREVDEPDWSNPNKPFASDVQTEIERIKRNDALAFIFPVWWYSVPAILKGYIDRVWTYGFAYGGSSKLPHKRVLWLGLASESEQQFKKRQYDAMMRHFFNIGVSNFTGIKESKVAFLYESLGSKVLEDGSYGAKYENATAHFDKLLEEAYQYGLNYATFSPDPIPDFTVRV